MYSASITAVVRVLEINFLRCINKTTFLKIGQHKENFKNITIIYQPILFYICIIYQITEKHPTPKGKIG